MIRSFVVTNQRDETLQIDLRDCTPDIIVVNVDGIGGPDGFIGTLSSPNIPGERFNQAKTLKRNIVLTLLNRKNTTGDTWDGRELLYKYFPVGREVIFEVITDHRHGVINAYVERNSINQFTRNENAEISLICPFPYFRAKESGLVSFGATQPGFFFPFSNNHLTNPTIFFGVDTDYLSREIIYPGDVDTGVVMEFVAGGPSSDITIWNTRLNQSMMIDMSIVEATIGGQMQLGDKIIIDTRYTRKKVMFDRSGVQQNILHALDLNSTWIRLYSGPNTIVYEMTIGKNGSRLFVDYDILYGGV